MFKQAPSVATGQQNHLLQQMTTENVYRAKLYVRFVIVLEILMLLRNFYTYGVSLHYYVILYLSFLAVAILTLVFLRTSERIAHIHQRARLQHHYLMAFYSFTLFWGVVVTLIDQSSYGHVTAYLTNFLVATVLFIVSRRSFILLHFFPTILLIVGMFIWQENTKILTGHFINITIFFIFATLGSRVLYNNRVRTFSQEVLLQEANQEMATLNRHLHQLVLRDELTRIPNRRGLYEYIQTHTTTPQSAAIYVLDIDSFKTYNDFYGHLAGDQVLKQVAQAIDTCMQEKGYFSARFGGEEFVVVALQVDEHTAQEIATCIFNTVAQLHIPHEKSVCHSEVSISLGYTLGTIENQATLESLIKEADDALYGSKQAGRNQIQRYKKE